MQRRELFPILGAAVAAAAPAEYKPRALSASQYATLDRILDLLLPADVASPGAKEAGVAMYIDTTLTHGDAAMRQVWIAGLQAFEGKSAAECTALLLRLAEKETNPSTEAEKFFVILKQSAINAYYLSDAGRRSLGYHGDHAIHDFPGCTHVEHKGS